LIREADLELGRFETSTGVFSDAKPVKLAENRWPGAEICGFDATAPDELTLTWHCKKKSLF
jgi:hypothetical protein